MEINSVFFIMGIIMLFVGAFGLLNNDTDKFLSTIALGMGIGFIMSYFALFIIEKDNKKEMENETTR